MFTFTVKPDGGEPYELTTTSRDVLHWEKVNKGKSLRQLGSEPSMTDFYALAHVTATRRQLFTGTLQEFEASVDIDLPTGEEDEEADPTQTVP